MQGSGARARLGAALLLMAVASAGAGHAWPQDDTSGSSRFIGRLRGDGRRLAGAGGATFDWRGVTAFRLLDLVARGRAAEAEAYLDFAARHRVTVVRVLARARHLFALSSEDGRAALPRLLEMARQRGVYVQVVALADTAGWSNAELAAQLDTVARIAERHENAILEYANEPYHHTQAGGLMAFVERHRAPFSGAWAQGAARDDTSDALADGSWVSVHLARGGGRWSRESRGRVLVDLSRRTGKFVVSNEPIGAADRAQPGRREDAPGAFAAQALLARLMGVGSTFHYDAGLQAELPRGQQLACFEAWREAMDAVPHDLGLPFAAAGEQGSPARGFGRDTAEAVFTAANDRRGWAVILGARGEPRVDWAPGWQVRARRDFGGAVLLEIASASGPA